MEKFSQTTLDDWETIAAQWQDNLFGIDFWHARVSEVNTTIPKYRRDLCNSPHVFAEQLFSNYSFVFTIHGLLTYTQRKLHTDPKFQTAVELLFT